MAEEKNVEPPTQSLRCLLCVDTVNEATLLSCGHTFCKVCLKRYHASWPERDHLLCPLCKEVTQLQENRIDGLPSNATVNELVNEYFGASEGVIAIFGSRQKCTACQIEEEAVCFCSSCNKYLCEKCLHCHQLLTSVFAGHRLIAVEDMVEGNGTRLQCSSTKWCSRHVSELKSIFCESCGEYICLKCVFDHRDHTLKKRDHFEGELRKKVDDLTQGSALKKTQLQTNIKFIEVQRQKMCTSMGKLRRALNDIYQEKATRLKESHKVLVEEIDALEQGFHDDLNLMKENDRQRIRRICGMISLVNNGRLGCLEANSLSTHTLICEELQGMLEKGIDETSAATILEEAYSNIFQSSEDTNTLELGKIVSFSNPLCSQSHITKCVDLLGRAWGIAKVSDDSIAIGYWGDHHGIDIIDSEGNTRQYTKAPPGIECRDLVFQEDGTLYTSTGEREVRMYSAKGFWESTITLQSAGYILTLNRSPWDEILITNGTNNVYIYDSTGSKIKTTVQTKHRVTLQASATRSGLIVASSCRIRDPDVVTVYDRDGNSGKPLEARKNVCLYAAVDHDDSVCVASVDCESGKVVFTCYILDGLDLREKKKFAEPSLVLLQHGWCYLVSLSPEKLAFACDEKLFFVTI